MKPGITGRNGRIDPTSEVVKTAPAGGGTPVPEPHHLAPPENAGGKMTDPKSTPERHSKCARCGAPISYKSADPGNYAMRVCDPCAIDLGEEVGQ